MRGRKPKERESYVLRMGDGSLVEVTREVYLEWYQSGGGKGIRKKKNGNTAYAAWTGWKKQEAPGELPGLNAAGLKKVL